MCIFFKIYYYTNIVNMKYNKLDTKIKDQIYLYKKTEEKYNKLLEKNDIVDFDEMNSQLQKYKRKKKYIN